MKPGPPKVILWITHWAKPSLIGTRSLDPLLRLLMHMTSDDVRRTPQNSECGKEVRNYVRLIFFRTYCWCDENSRMMFPVRGFGFDGSNQPFCLVQGYLARSRHVPPPRSQWTTPEYDMIQVDLWRYDVSWCMWRIVPSWSATSKCSWMWWCGISLNYDRLGDQHPTESTLVSSDEIQFCVRTFLLSLHASCPFQFILFQ